jgi:putative endopeptidase
MNIKTLEKDLKLSASSLSPEIRPQDNLYLHVNQKWLKKAKIPADRDRWGGFAALRELNVLRLKRLIESIPSGSSNPLEKKLKNFYTSGLNSNRARSSGLTRLSDMFSQVDQVDSLQALCDLLGRLHLLGVSAFWGPYVMPDEVNSRVNIFRLEQAGLSLPDSDYYFSKNPKVKAIRAKLHQHIEKMFSLIDHDDADIGDTVFALEKQIAANSMNSTQLRDVAARYNKLSLAELKKAYPNIDWQAYFKGLGIRQPRLLVVDQVRLFSFYNELFGSLDMKSVRIYLKWHIYKSLAECLGDKIFSVHFEFYGKTLGGTQKTPATWKRLVQATDIYLGDALGKLYIKTHFPAQAKKRMDSLVENLYASFAARLDDLSWMSASTKKAARRKLSKFKTKIGYPSNPKTYAGLKLTADSYIDNVLSVRVYLANLELAKLGQPVDGSEWYMSAPTVNAYYSPNRNEIVFPAGILQPPFFDAAGNEGVNYGAIGAVICHEITHGFDDTGRLYDEAGRLKNWWLKSDRDLFKGKAEGMVRLANSYRPLPDVALNGQLTLGENIADLGGAEIAFAALQSAIADKPEAYQAEQKRWFFYSLAYAEHEMTREARLRQIVLTDEHPPGEFRVNNTARNMDSFYTVFDVKPGDKMYLPPEERVRLW